jgi:hypothetical protein
MGIEDITIRVNAEELGYLRQLASRNANIAALIDKRQCARGKLFVIELASAEAVQLRGYLSEQLALCGFDSDYALTNEGQMLEDLIDRFFIP